MPDIFERRELKYLVSAEERALLEAVISKHMRPDSHGESTIRNIYYDTPDYRLIRDSLEKPLYKEKLRLRSYELASPDSEVFLELKKKYDGVVYKRRILLPEEKAASLFQSTAAVPLFSQIGSEISSFLKYYRTLRPAVFLCYDRQAWFDTEDSEFRVTFDTNIRYRTDRLSLCEEADGKQLLTKGQSLLEVKAAGAIPLWFVRALSEYKIRQVSFSKYGRAYEDLTQNKTTYMIGGRSYVSIRNRQIG